MKPILIYCYDAYCGWCYGFSKVITQVTSEYAHMLDVEVLSGGMLLPAKPVHISAIAGFIASEYLNVEQLTGVKFGRDYLWHILNPSESDWYPNSEKSSIAMCVLKDLQPKSMIAFASDLQYALHFEGRDLTDDETYRHLLPKYDINKDQFLDLLRSEKYKIMAYEEFALVKQLGVNGFPAILLQNERSEFYWISSGYTPYENVRKRLEEVLAKSS